MLETLNAKTIISDCLNRSQLCLQEALILFQQLDTAPSSAQNYREELCVGAANIRRGYYCPSPVLDLVTGNIKRGKITKRPTKRSKPTNRYLFDDSGKLRVVETFGVQHKTLGGEYKSTEYLFYFKNRIVGVEVSSGNRIQSISEEQYVDGRLQHYIVSFFLSLGSSANSQYRYECTKIDYEQYRYDDEGLVDAGLFTVYPAENQIYGYQYRFIRENGYLKQYYSIDTPDELANPKIFYNIRVDRKA